jgi:hypothetical protein
VVGVDSHEVSRASCYSGIPRACSDFRLRASHPLWSDFPFASSNRHTALAGLLQPHRQAGGLASSAFARHYLRNRIRFLFLWLLRCFTSPGFASAVLFDSHGHDRVLPRPGYPIRKSTGQSVFAALRGLSQLITSFFASWRQGIHHVLFVA